MNEITARFAAMAEKAAASSPSRRPGESEQAALDRAVAEELASLDRDDPPPPAFDPYDGPAVKPTTNDARGRAIAYVSRLIESYRFIRRDPGRYKVGVTAKLTHLTAELGLMMAARPEGDRLARRWDFLCGDLV